MKTIQFSAVLSSGRSKRFIFLSLFALLASFALQAQTIRYVKHDATGATNGTSWTNAYTDLQVALNAAAVNDTIWVAAGTYNPTQKPTGVTTLDTRLQTFYLNKNVKLYGGFAGTETQLSQRNYAANSTVLSGDLGVVGNVEDNCYHVFITIGLTAATVIDGFTVKDGKANGLGLMNYAGISFSSNAGGGFYNQSSSPTLTNLTVKNNSASGYGGGFYNSSSSPTLTNLTVNNNSVSTELGGTSGYGGGFYNGSGSSPTLTNVTVSGNTSTYNGGGFYNNSGSPVLTNVLVSENTAASQGGGFCNESSSPILTNVTISRNTGLQGGGLFNSGGSSPRLYNSIIWNNGSNGVSNISSEPIFYFSIIEGAIFVGTGSYGIDGGNNSDSDPLFVSAGNLSLQNGSPAINSGSSSDNNTTTDLAGNPRIRSGIIDRGAYEGFACIAFMPSVVVASSNANNSIFSGTSVTFTATPISGGATPTNGGATPTYQWKKNNSDVGTNAATYTDAGLVNGDVIQVVMTSSDTCASPATATSNAITIAVSSCTPVTPSVTIVSNRTSATSITFTATPINGGATPTYQWKRYSSDVGTGATYTTRFSNGTVIKVVMTSSDTCASPATATSNSITMDASALVAPRYVKHNATGANDGTSWTNAYTDLQVAMNAAAVGDEIWVAAGTYKPTQKPTGVTYWDSRLQTFYLNKNVKLYGGFAGTETTLSQRNATNITILSGDIGTEGTVIDNCYHVFITQSLTSAAVIDRFTVNGGNANGSNSMTYNTVSFLSNYGGGFYNDSSSPTFTDVTVSHNSATNGGGFHNRSSASPTLTNVTVSYNSAFYGGGFSNESASPTLTNVIVNNNSAFTGGGFHNYNSLPTLTNVTVSQNSAEFGGGFSNQLSSPTLTNVTVNNNSATDVGGGFFNNSASPTLINVTVNNNSATNDGGGFYNGSSSPIIRNSIIWNNGSSNVSNQVGSLPTFSYTIVKGSGGSSAWVSSYGTNGGNNLDIDPLFVSSTNFSLQATSPAINAGNSSYNTTTTDLAGNPRIRGSAIDMGAYEVTSACTPVTPSVVINSSDADNNINAGTSVTFTATPTNGGTTPAYQWKKNSTNVGTNAATYTDAGLLGGDVITVVMTSSDICASPATATSNAIAITVIVCMPPTASITVTNNNGNYLLDLATNGTQFLWSNAATTEDITVSVAGTYSVTVTNAAGCTTTTSAIAQPVSAQLYQLQVTDATCGGLQPATLHLNMNTRRNCMDALMVKIQFDSTKVFFEPNMIIQKGAAIDSSGRVFYSIRRDTIFITVDLSTGCIQGDSGTNVLRLPFRLRPTFALPRATSAFNLTVLEERIVSGTTQDNRSQSFEVTGSLLGKIQVFRPNGNAVLGTVNPITVFAGDTCTLLNRAILADSSSNAVVRLDSFRYVRFHRAPPALASPLIGGYDVFLLRNYLHGAQSLTARQKVAADVNNDGVISTLDITILRRRAINFYTSFAEASAGRLTSDYQFTLQNSDTPNVCFRLPALAADCDTPSIQLNMITLGDINGDTDTTTLAGGIRENGSNGIAKLNKQLMLQLCRATRVANEWKIPVFADAVTRGLDLQLLNIPDTGVFRVESANPTAFEVSANGRGVGNNYYIIGYANNLQGISANDTLLYLYVKTAHLSPLQLGNLKGYLDAQEVYTQKLVCTPTSDLYTNPYEVYPNPTTGAVQMTTQKPLSENMTLRIYDMLGRCVKTQVLERGEIHFTIEMAELANSVYQFHFENQSIKVVKQ